jgi:hypothetical protein
LNLLQRLRQLFSDTLFKRLMLLMWVALVASHFLSFAAVRSLAEGRGDGPPMRSAAPMPRPEGVPPLSSLPPGLLPDGGGHGPGGPPPPGRQPGGSPPMRSLWLDYLVRFLVIGGAAWWGAQWLSQPMRRLADASRALGQAITQRRPAPTLDEHAGTREVRQAAQVFNTMAQRLHEQFDAQGLLMAAISHDLRTPLARLRLRLETMEPGPQTERGIADLQEMDALIGSVLSMVRDRHAPQAQQRGQRRGPRQRQQHQRWQRTRPVHRPRPGRTAGWPADAVEPARRRPAGATAAATRLMGAAAHAQTQFKWTVSELIQSVDIPDTAGREHGQLHSHRLVPSPCRTPFATLHSIPLNPHAIPTGSPTSTTSASSTTCR